MVSRQEKAVFFCQEEMDSCFWSRRFRDNYELQVLRLMHPNISCLGLRYHLFPIWKRHGHGRPVEAMHSISCSSATLDPEPTFQQCLIYCYRRWESAYGFCRISKLAIGCYCFLFARLTMLSKASSLLSNSCYYHFPIPIKYSIQSVSQCLISHLHLMPVNCT